jgi:hypothetical protein
MTFKAYIDNIQAKTGKSPDDFKAYAAERGFTLDGKLSPAVKVMAIVADLKRDFGPGHGHAMAVVELLKGRKPNSD